MRGDVLGFELQWRWPWRRGAQAAARFDSNGKGGYDEENSMGLGGKRREAHSASDGIVRELGDGLVTANPSMESGGRARRRRLVAAIWGSRGGVARGGRR